MEILNARHLKPLETQRVQTTVLPSKGSNHVSRPNRPLPTCLSSPDVYDIKSNQVDHEMSTKASDNLINEVTSRCQNLEIAYFLSKETLLNFSQKLFSPKTVCCF